MGLTASKNRTANAPQSSRPSPRSSRIVQKLRGSVSISSQRSKNSSSKDVFSLLPWLKRASASKPKPSFSNGEMERISGAVTRVSAAFRGHSARTSISLIRHDGVRPESSTGHGLVQAAGHAGILQRSGNKVIKIATKREKYVYESVQSTPLQDFLPKYHGAEDAETMCHILMEDLTAGMRAPAVMDIKMGFRTFLESEADNPKRRLDLVEKMLNDDPSALTAEERENGVTKLRYMQYRDCMSSSQELGWRIEGLCIGEREYDVPARKLASREQAVTAIKWWLQGCTQLRQLALSKLIELRRVLEESEWFGSHEIVASSLLFVYDSAFEKSKSEPEVRVHMIDFAKTSPLTEASISHRRPWEMGNHEDGYLTGLDSLINAFQEMMLREERASAEIIIQMS